MPRGDQGARPCGLVPRPVPEEPERSYRLVMKSADGKTHEFHGYGENSGGKDRDGHERTARYTRHEARRRMEATAEEYDKLHTGRHAGGKLTSAKIILDETGELAEWWTVRAGKCSKLDLCYEPQLHPSRLVKEAA